MHLDIQPFTVHKRFALTISRGTTAKTTNIWLRVQQDGIEGWGEASPFSIGDRRQTSAEIVTALEQIAPVLEPYSPLDRQKIEPMLLKLPSAARAAVDMALYDWLGKRVGLPLWRLWGLDRDRIVPTSVTIGISSPEAAQNRVRAWLAMDGIQRCPLKVKLGSPEGVEADRAMLAAVREEAPDPRPIGVDANGGWTLEEAIDMCRWLAEMGVTSVEQPLKVGREQDLPQLYHQSPLPIVVDESCFGVRDIPQLADCVHGINIKLMKSGGLTEAMRMVHTAKAFGLQVMLGCYSNSAIANTAAAQLAPFADYVDLDSHLNLSDDPFTGALIQNGRLMPNDGAGLGVKN